MLFYITLVFIFTFLLHHSISMFDKNNKISVTLSCFYVLIFALIGGLRNLDVGTDLQGYGSLYFYWADVSKPFFKYLSESDSKEFGWFALIYLCKSITTEIHFYLFVQEFIKMSLIIATAYYFRHRIKPYIFIFSYFCFFAFYGFSMMRQTLALTLCIYSLTYLDAKRYVMFAVMVLLGYSCHNSAILFAITPAIYFFAQKNIKTWIIIVVCVLSYSFLIPIMIYIESTGLLNEGKATGYMDTGVVSAKTNMLLAIYVIICGFILKRMKIIKDQRTYINIILYNSILTLFMLMLSSYIEVAFRVSYYFWIVIMILFPIIIQKRKDKMLTMMSIGYLLLFMLHLYISCTHDLGGTIPYKSLIWDALI